MTFVGAEERALWVAAAVRALPRIVPTEPPYSDAVRDGVMAQVVDLADAVVFEYRKRDLKWFDGLDRPYNGALS
jgi:hypothetical protein